MQRFSVCAAIFLALVAGAHAQCASVKSTVGASSIFWQAAEAAGLVGKVTQGGVTLLAPTDTAFTDLLALLSLTPEELLAETDTLEEILKFHILSSPKKKSAFTGSATFPTKLDDGSCSTNEVKVQSDGTLGGGLTTATVGDADIKVCKGSYVHFIDAVLVPCPVSIGSQSGGSGGGSG